MLHLANSALRIDILEPVADAARLGPRFCWGGYIWQVHDPIAGPLLTGPEWPEPEPNAYNGQGLPESFRHRTLEGRPLTWRGERGVAIGVGQLALGADGTPAVVSPCAWTISAHADRIIFDTRHEAAGFRYELMRSIELHEGAVRSTTRLTNATEERLTLEWFAHPFFALCSGMATAQLPAGSTLPENPGFILSGHTLMQKRGFVRQNDGHMERGLRLPPKQPLLATLTHPRLGGVTMETSFVPDACIIWGNDRTFSIEPYLTLDLAPREAREWSVEYRFEK